MYQSYFINLKNVVFDNIKKFVYKTENVLHDNHIL